MKKSDLEFHSYFEKIYDSRWLSLFEALKNPEKQVCYSPFKKLTPYLETPEAFLFTDPEQSMTRNSMGLIENYILDPSSLLPIKALQVQQDSVVLDLCAAPGGKSLALSSQIGPEGELISNDSSKDRFNRLKKVLKQYSSLDRVKTLNKDGTKFGFYFQDHFDRILVDAPCSSERHHIWQNKTSTWKPKQSKYLSVKQYTLLCAGLIALKPEGLMAYSTCSINPLENDEVIRRFLKKKGDLISLESIDLSYLGAEKTEFGWICLPDRAHYGPIYVALLRKT